MLAPLPGRVFLSFGPTAGLHGSTFTSALDLSRVFIHCPPLNNCSSVSIQRSGNSPRDGFRGAPKQIIIQVGISRSGCHLSVPKQPAATGTEACVCVPQIVQANAY
jgi:hypothetical protein